MINQINRIYGIEDDYTEIASISQNNYQYDNYNIKLYKHNNTGKLVMIEDMSADSNFYDVSDDEITDNNYDDFVRDCARNWANNGEEDCRLQMIAWGFQAAENYEVDKDYEDQVKVLVISHYYGYEPVGYVVNDRGENIIFDSYADAENWINEQNNDTYYLSHGEHSRPDYYIVEQ